MTEPKKTIKKTVESDQKRANNKANKKNDEIKIQVSDNKLEEIKIAKAGKRSAKSIKEAEKEKAKAALKIAKTDEKTVTKPTLQQKPPHSRLARRAKGYRKSAELVDNARSYTLIEALELAKRTNHVKFDATVEVHIKLAVDPKQADQNIRDTVVLPAGSGKSIKVAVFAEADDIAKAKQAGADVVGNEEFLQQLDNEELNFDVLIASPTMMTKLGKYARLLGPKGLMPNPKSGTVTNDIAKAVKEAKAGRIEYRVDSSGIVHAGIGKVSFASSELAENATALINSVRANKPASVKGAYMLSVYLATSMGPSIELSINNHHSL